MYPHFFQFTYTYLQYSTLTITLNNFVMDLKQDENTKGRNWLSADILYTPTQKGGLDFINFRAFIKALKITWIGGCNNHCCDRMGRPGFQRNWKTKPWYVFHLLTNCILILTKHILMKNHTEDTTKEYVEDIVLKLKLLHHAKLNHMVCDEIRQDICK